MKIANLNVRPLTIFLVALVLNAAQLEAATKPNIIYILADDLGYGDLGCFGQRMLKTPNIDRLAAEGMRLTRHYAGSTVCAPSRCVLLTGLHTGHCTVRGNGPGQLKDDDVTVAAILKVLFANADQARELVRRVVPLTGAVDPCEEGCDRALENAIVTAENVRDADLMARLDAVALATVC